MMNALSWNRAPLNYRSSLADVRSGNRPWLRRQRKRRVLLLKIQQIAFGLQATAVTRQCAVGADHAVTWDDDRERVLAIRGTHGARRRGIADTPRDLAISGSGAVW